MGRYRSKGALRQCYTCEDEKLFDEFYENEGNICKECKKKYDQQYRKTERGKKCKEKARKRYRKTEGGKQVQRRENERQRQKHPQKIKAYKAVERAIKSGKLIKPDKYQVNNRNCKGRIEAHHDDYDKQLDVEWFCIYHHRMILW